MGQPPTSVKFRALQARLARMEEEQEAAVKRLLSRVSSRGSSMLLRLSGSGLAVRAGGHEHMLVARPCSAVTVKCHKCKTDSIWSHRQKALICTECGFSVRSSLSLPTSGRVLIPDSLSFYLSCVSVSVGVLRDLTATSHNRFTPHARASEEETDSTMRRSIFNHGVVTATSAHRTTSAWHAMYG